MKSEVKILLSQSKETKPYILLIDEDAHGWVTQIFLTEKELFKIKNDIDAIVVLNHQPKKIVKDQASKKTIGKAIDKLMGVKIIKDDIKFIGTSINTVEETMKPLKDSKVYKKDTVERIQNEVLNDNETKGIN